MSIHRFQNVRIQLVVLVAILEPRMNRIETRHPHNMRSTFFHFPPDSFYTIPEIRIGVTVILKWRWDNWNTLGFSVAGINHLDMCTVGTLDSIQKVTMPRKRGKGTPSGITGRRRGTGQDQELASNTSIVVSIEQADAFLVEEGDDGVIAHAPCRHQPTSMLHTSRCQSSMLMQFWWWKRAMSWCIHCHHYRWHPPSLLTMICTRNAFRQTVTHAQDVEPYRSFLP